MTNDTCVRPSVSGIRFAICVLALLAAITASAGAAHPEPMLLWPAGAPGAKGTEEQDQPSIRVYQAKADQANGAAVVICPGGGYQVLATDHEGAQVAQWFQSHGVTAIVLRYRLGPRYQHPMPLKDVQRALRHARTHAKELGISSRRIGVMGFSAGGHLASTAATHFDDGDPSASDPVDRVSCRPDFAVLGYPVISFKQPFTHGGSRRNLLGESADEKLVESLSNETQVTEKTPPCFLFHTGEDAGVPVENSLAFYQACRAAKVPAELHVYQFGPHGVGLANGDPVLATWKERLHDWMRTSGLFSDAPRVAVAGEVLVAGKPLAWGMISLIPRDSDQDSTTRPIAYAMVSRGKYSIPAQRGASVGACRIEIHDFGAVEPRPTVDHVRRLPAGAITISAGDTTVNVEMKDEG